jgi:hypothetical protein
VETDQFPSSLAESRKVRIIGADYGAVHLPTEVDETVELGMCQVCEIQVGIPGNDQLQPLQTQGVR